MRHRVALKSLAVLAVTVPAIALSGARALGGGIDDPVGSWASTSSLIARVFHTATLLADGRVLIVGGDAQGGPPNSLASAELYDPRSGHWSHAASLTTARSHHTATALGGFKVLVVGGIDRNYQSIASAELYDARADRWSPAARLAEPRVGHTATLLPDGNVLVVGGGQVKTDSWWSASAESYNPSSNSWRPVASMQTGRSDHTATLLANGKVLVVGGSNPSGDGPLGVLSGAELYDPVSDSWSSASNLATARSKHTATLLGDGRVLVVGGGDGSGYGIASAELYDPATNSWTAAASLTFGRVASTATLLGNGQVLVFGGQVTSGPAASAAELYDPKSDRWTVSTFKDFRSLHTATPLANGQVLIVGGINLPARDVINSGVVFTPTPISVPAVSPATATGALPTTGATVASPKLPRGVPARAQGLVLSYEVKTALVIVIPSLLLIGFGALFIARRRKRRNRGGV